MAMGGEKTKVDGWRGSSFIKLTGVGTRSLGQLVGKTAEMETERVRIGLLVRKQGGEGGKLKRLGIHAL